MAEKLIRIFSDLHYGDQASVLHTLPALAPLFDGADQIILNGDTFDTRPSQNLPGTAAIRAEVLDFVARQSAPVTLLTGNHDPDLSKVHALELADRRVLVTHGDILFEDLVPWSRDADILRQRVDAELSALPPGASEQLANRLIAVRRAAATISQRHQSERHRLKYLAGFISDTLWPPLRILRVLRAWRETPARAAALVSRHALPAKFFVMGHTHRVGVVHAPSGLIILNTGSFCPPCAGAAVELTSDRLALRRIERHGQEFRFGRTLAEFALAHP